MRERWVQHSATFLFSRRCHMDPHQLVVIQATVQRIIFGSLFRRGHAERRAGHNIDDTARQGTLSSAKHQPRTAAPCAIVRWQRPCT